MTQPLQPPTAPLQKAGTNVQPIANPPVPPSQGGKPVGTGGPEGLSAKVEKGGSGTSSTESAPNNEKSAENSNEKQSEKVTTQKVKQQVPQQQAQPSKQVKKEFKPEPKPPQVYGYKIPPQIGTNYKLIASNKGKGDPKSGLANLYLFLDRLLKVNKKRVY